MYERAQEGSRATQQYLCNAGAASGFLLSVLGLLVACASGAANAPAANATSSPNAPSQGHAPAPTESVDAATTTAPISAVAPAPVDKEEPAPSSNSAVSDSKNAAASETTPPPSTVSQESSEPSVLASEILTAPKVAFLVDYSNSEAKEKAQASCENDPKKDDPAAKSACLQKARNQFMPDVLVFQKEKKDHATLIIYKRNDSSLKEVFVATITFTHVTAHSVQLKFIGGSRGQRPLFKNTNSPTLNLPNDYTVEIDDPEFGKLQYEAKVGFVDR